MILFILSGILDLIRRPIILPKIIANTLTKVPIMEIVNMYCLKEYAILWTNNPILALGPKSLNITLFSLIKSCELSKDLNKKTT